MGFRNRSGSLRRMASYYHRLPDEIADNIENTTAQEAAREGAELMREFIRTRGTAKSGKAGRIETEEMLRRVKSKVDRDGKGKIRIQWGWLSGRRKYFRYQEQGFRHVSGQDVEAMHALLDSYIQTSEKVSDDLDRKFK